MANYSSHVGVRFREQFTGFIGLGTSDPELGANRAAAAGQSFRCEIELEIDSVHAFVSDPQRDARITGGTVSWDGTGSPATAAVERGIVRFFDPIPDQPRQRRIVYQIAVTTADQDYVLHGEKRLADDVETPAAADLTTLWAIIGMPTGDAAGRLESHLAGWIESLQEPEVLRASSPAEALAARKALLGFFNSQMRALYAHPLTDFSADDFLTNEQADVLRFMAKVFLPHPLPANGPSYDDAVDGVQRFFTHADTKRVRQIRSLLQVAGLLLPIAHIGPKDARAKLLPLLESEADSPIRHALVALNGLILFAYYAHPRAGQMVGYKQPVHVPRVKTKLPVAFVP